MKAVAVFPGKPDSMHLTDLPEPSVEDVPEERSVLVEVLRVGVDGTDGEINAGEYGASPEGYDFLAPATNRWDACSRWARTCAPCVPATT